MTSDCLSLTAALLRAGHSPRTQPLLTPAVPLSTLRQTPKPAPSFLEQKFLATFLKLFFLLLLSTGLGYCLLLVLILGAVLVFSSLAMS